MLQEKSTHKERLVHFIVLNFVGLGYMITNYIVSLDAPYRSLNMQWEAYIPFVSWTIFPYLSYFLMAPFIFILPHKREDLVIYMFRFVVVALVTFLIFILFPYQNAFIRPIEAYEGVEWFLFELLNTDMPYNQMPSFHISLSLLYTLIIIDFFKRKWVVVSVLIWFFMICCSVLLLFQHHLADIVSAIILVILSVKLSQINTVQRIMLNAYRRIYKRFKS